MTTTETAETPLFEVGFMPFFEVRHFGDADFRLTCDWNNSSQGEWSEAELQWVEDTPNTTIGCLFLDAILDSQSELFESPAWNRAKTIKSVEQSIVKARLRLAEKQTTELSQHIEEHLAALHTLHTLLTTEATP